MVVCRFVPSPSPNRKPLLVALSVVLGVMFAASGQHFLHGLPGEAPDGSGAVTLVAAPPSGGLTGPADPTSSTTPASTTTDAPYTSTSAGEPADSAGESENSPTSSAVPSERNSPPSPPATRETAADEQETTPEPAPRNEHTTSAEPPRAEPPSPRDGARAAEVVDLVNYVRSRAGCGPVRTNSSLTAAAQTHSEDMSARDYFSHTTPEGVGFAERARSAGYSSPAAENIAKGPSEPEAVMRMWMESRGQRTNILNCNLSTIGVGVTTNGWYWTQDFGY